MGTEDEHGFSEGVSVCQVEVLCRLKRERDVPTLRKALETGLTRERGQKTSLRIEDEPAISAAVPEKQILSLLERIDLPHLSAKAVADDGAFLRKVDHDEGISVREPALHLSPSPGSTPRLSHQAA